MHKIIRPNVFETNSSSTHSICITESTELLQSIKPDRDGLITLTGGEFGWEQKTHYDPLTKANYAAVDQLYNEDRIEMLKRVIIKHTGAKSVVINIDTDNYSSYIDHQSSGTSNDAFVSDDALKRYLFSSHSFIETDNDNH